MTHWSQSNSSNLIQDSALEIITCKIIQFTFGSSGLNELTCRALMTKCGKWSKIGLAPNFHQSLTHWGQHYYVIWKMYYIVIYSLNEIKK